MDPNENKNYYPEDPSAQSGMNYNGGAGQNPANGQYQGQQYSGAYQTPDYQGSQYSPDPYQNSQYSAGQYQTPDYQAGQYQAPQYQPASYQSPYQAAPYEENPRKGSGMAIASMICGILSVVFCCGMWISWILSLIAIILGAVAVGKKTGGKGMAIAGIITGALGLVLSIALLIIIVAAGETANSFEYYNYYSDLF